VARSSGRATTSGCTEPVWGGGDGYKPAGFEGPPTTGVCVVGAGIAGLTTAYLLAEGGTPVVVIDEKPIGGGETGRTSAHLARALDDGFSNLERMHGAEATATHYRSHAAAIDLIERIVTDEQIDCDFARVDGFLFPGDGASADRLDEELAAARRAGVTGVDRTDRAWATGGDSLPCLRFPRQARFHPLRYINGLAQAVERRGVRFLLGARVRELSGDGPVRAVLGDGLELSADAGVAATNVPAPIENWMGVYTKVASYRSYVIGMEVSGGTVPDALLWDMEDPYHYVRLHRTGGRDMLLVGGEDHKTGQAPEGGERVAFERLESWARSRYPGAGPVVSRWSGQVCEPTDGVAFIGRAPTDNHRACFVITGDSGMGLTHGTLGAVLVSDLILGRANPWEELYSPARRPYKAAGEFLRENLNAAATLRDYVTPGESGSIEEIRAGCGAVVREGLKKLAVYRDPDGTVHKRSAVCPHLKCIVRWNGVESSWDCPCHGSRFDAHGRLIIGPAVDDLEEI
jgi:glycine/D-amino acid oxidase-like deaminating enzyme/nitrite reductase/ring-hydroxylating ferredoxin subunit